MKNQHDGPVWAITQPAYTVKLNEGFFSTRALARERAAMLNKIYGFGIGSKQRYSTQRVNLTITLAKEDAT